ncbi:MAG: hypothetical protein ACJ76F_12095 [Bacteroidia bacterium]
MKQLLQKIISFSVFIFLLSSCYIPRGFEKQVSIKIADGFNCELKSFVSQPQYLYYKTADEYKSSFLEGLKNETGYSKNVFLVTADTARADYLLVVNYLYISESDSRQTVNDPKSPDNGNTYLLASCDGRVSFEWYDAVNGEKIRDGNASLVKTEKLKNNRNVVQLATGTNKDNTQYRQKMLSDDVCDDIARKCGSRTWSAASAKLARFIRKRK